MYFFRVSVSSLWILSFPVCRSRGWQLFSFRDWETSFQALLSCKFVLRNHDYYHGIIFTGYLVFFSNSFFCLFFGWVSGILFMLFHGEILFFSWQFGISYTWILSSFSRFGNFLLWFLWIYFYFLYSYNSEVVFVLLCFDAFGSFDSFSHCWIQFIWSLSGLGYTEIVIHYVHHAFYFWHSFYLPHVSCWTLSVITMVFALGLCSLPWFLMSVPFHVPSHHHCQLFGGLWACKVPPWSRSSSVCTVCPVATV